MATRACGFTIKSRRGIIQSRDLPVDARVVPGSRADPIERFGEPRTPLSRMKLCATFFACRKGPPACPYQLLSPITSINAGELSCDLYSIPGIFLSVARGKYRNICAPRYKKFYISGKIEITFCFLFGCFILRGSFFASPLEIYHYIPSLREADIALYSHVDGASTLTLAVHVMS